MKVVAFSGRVWVMLSVMSIRRGRIEGKEDEGGKNDQTHVPLSSRKEYMGDVTEKIPRRGRVLKVGKTGGGK